MRTNRFALLSGVALPVLLTLFAWSPRLARADDGSPGADRIEGAWSVEVTILSACGPTGVPIATVPAMNLFIRGGALTETPGALTVPPPPILRGSPGLGTWQRLKGRHYAASFQFFRLSDNIFAGVQRIIESIELSKDGDQFTATGTSQVSDSSGTLIQEGCNTETATRIE